MSNLPNLDFPQFPAGWRLGPSSQLPNRWVAIGPGAGQVIWSRFYDPRPDTIPADELADIARRAWNRHRCDEAHKAAPALSINRPIDR